jgi:hypothetical protein
VVLSDCVAQYHPQPQHKGGMQPQMEYNPASVNFYRKKRFCE